MKESGLQRTLLSLQDEVKALREELATVRKDKFALQSQVAELQAALHSSLEHSKVSGQFVCKGHICRYMDLTSMFCVCFAVDYCEYETLLLLKSLYTVTSRVGGNEHK